MDANVYTTRISVSAGITSMHFPKVCNSFLWQQKKSELATGPLI